MLLIRDNIVFSSDVYGRAVVEAVLIPYRRLQTVHSSISSVTAAACVECIRYGYGYHRKNT